MANVAMIGNPNVGKSVVFNALTGLRQKVANFPGCTVEKKEGVCELPDKTEIQITDLPGIYSLTPHSIDEKIARNYILEEKPDLIIDVIDASNLERNLYLTMQLKELGARIIIVLNMMDLARGKGIKVYAEKLSKFLGVPVVPTVASKGIGFDELKNQISKVLETGFDGEPLLFSNATGEAISTVAEEISSLLGKKYSANWLAASLLENDEVAWEFAKPFGITKEKFLEKINEQIETKLNGDGMVAITDARYSLIRNFIDEVQKTTESKRWTLSDALDEVFTHKIWGIPIFIVVLWGVFQFTFSFGDPFIGLIEMIFGYLGDLILLIHNGAFAQFIVGTFIDGVGSVLVFLPNIILLFLAISFLEDSGYLSRVTFIMDKLMTKIGLHGQSFIPMLMGFGCNVPAIMATRSIKNENDRMTTIMVNGFMSCGARLPVYILFAGAFAVTLGSPSTITLSLYLGGIVIAIFTAWTLRHTLFRGEGAPFIMELQSYTVPTAKNVSLKTWDRSKSFLKKASSVIIIAVAVIWLFDNVSLYVESIDANRSILQEIGSLISYLFWWMKTDGKLLGWEFGAALLFGLIAKEVVVASLGTSLLDNPDLPEDDPTLQGAITLGMGPAAALAFMVFSLLYAPCVAALGAIKSETNSWKWMFFNILLTTAIAYVCAIIVYYITGAIVGFGFQAGIT